MKGSYSEFKKCVKPITHPMVMPRSWCKCHAHGVVHNTDSCHDCSQWRIQGVRTPPPFGPRCRLFNINPKVGPPLGPPPFLLVDLRSKMDPSGGSRVCVCDRGDHPAPPPWNVDDVTRAMSKGGGGCLVLVNVQEWGCFSKFLRADDVMQTMSGGGGCL